MMDGAPAASLGHGMALSMETHVKGGSPLLDISMVSPEFLAPSLLLPSSLLLYE